MKDSELRAERAMERAVQKLQKLASYNGPYGGRVNAEREYAQSYQDMVSLGLRPQIRAKYRP